VDNLKKIGPFQDDAGKEITLFLNEHHEVIRCEVLYPDPVPLAHFVRQEALVMVHRTAGPAMPCGGQARPQRPVPVQRPGGPAVYKPGR
jgi:hypothetical protein